MKKIIFLHISLLFYSYSISQNNNSTVKKRVISTINSTYTDKIVLIQEFTVNIPLDSVWNTFTTKTGWESAFVAITEIDLKIGISGLSLS